MLSVILTVLKVIGLILQAPILLPRLYRRVNTPEMSAAPRRRKQPAVVVPEHTHTEPAQNEDAEDPRHTIRVPVTWKNHVGAAPDYTIRREWLDRVQQVVDWCREEDLYVIIDMHHESSWLTNASKDYDQTMREYRAIWTQIASRFQDYDEHLIFESMNEEFDGTYGTPNTTYYSNINTYNQIFVDTVRQTGGNNDKRWLMIPGWNTNIEYTAGSYGFSLPTDNYLSSSISSGQKRIMVSVHYYDPWDFCGQETDGKWFWGEANHVGDGQHDCTWGEEDGKEGFLCMGGSWADSAAGEGVPQTVLEQPRFVRRHMERYDHAVPGPGTLPSDYPYAVCPAPGEIGFRLWAEPRNPPENPAKQALKNAIAHWENEAKEEGRW